MTRVYLEEDIRLIRTYFPGARRTALRTPFDLTDKPVRLPLGESFRDTGAPDWYGELVWNR